MKKTAIIILAIITFSACSSENTNITSSCTTETTIIVTDLTDDMLIEKAMDYYEKTNGQRPPCAGVMKNDDGTVSIQLYESLSEHNSTWAWYRYYPDTGKWVDDIMLKEIIIE